MVQIEWHTKADETAVPVLRTISVPETLACAVSVHLRFLCSTFPDRRIFEADEIVGEPIADFEARLHNGSFYSLMAIFVKWLYGSDLDFSKWAVDLWYLGDTLGSPTFQKYRYAPSLQETRRLR